MMSDTALSMGNLDVLADVVGGPSLMQQVHEEGQGSEISFSLTHSSRSRSRASFITLSDAGVQTEPIQSAQVLATEALTEPIRPPQIPRPLAHQSRRATVNLRTTRLVMAQFQETPAQTLERLVWDILRQINPRGRGCCYTHVGLLVLQQCISVMTVRQCRQNLTPYHGWQCMSCFALNEDAPELEEPVCGVCWSEPSVTEQNVEEERAPSGDADVEYSDIDSLASAA